MSTKTLDKVLGWFVVREEGAPAETLTEEPRGEEPAVTRGKAHVPTHEEACPPRPPVVAPGKAHDAASFAEVYRAAGIAGADHERVERALELLRTLPDATPIDVRRTIVEASMKAFGIPVDGMLSTAAAALEALETYRAEGEARTADVLADARARIARLEGEIAEIRKLTTLQEASQTELAAATAREHARVEALFAFFGETKAARTT